MDMYSPQHRDLLFVHQLNEEDLNRLNSSRRFVNSLLAEGGDGNNDGDTAVALRMAEPADPNISQVIDQARDATPDPVTPDPVTPDPVTPDPVTPDPVTQSDPVGL